jgi:hypothetical protein
MEDCLFCSGAIDGDAAPGQIYTEEGVRHSHWQCSLREVIGGIGHLVAHPYWCTQMHDPDAGLTYRQSSLLVAAWIEVMGVEEAANQWRGSDEVPEL